MKVTGKEPGTFLELKGKSITYGVTMLKDAPNKEGAIAFVQCLFGGSGRNGATPVHPMQGSNGRDEVFVACKAARDG